MILGHRCFKTPNWAPLSWKEVAQRAKDRVDNFLFVGLVSEWSLSICLFNFIMTGARYVTPFQLKKCNPTALPTNMTATQAYNKSGLPVDRLDHAVYEHAQRRFWDDVKTYGISETTCRTNVTAKNFGCQSWPRFLHSIRMLHASIVAHELSSNSTCVAGVCYERPPAPPRASG